MATQTATLNAAKPNSSIEQQMRELVEIYADAPQYVRSALEKALPTLMADATEAQTSGAETAGRIGARLGSVSELTLIVPFAPGGARRLRSLLRLLNGSFSGGKKVGTLHNMRFVFLHNDTTLLFATAYDGQWDAYIDDFATMIPADMDIIFSACEGWPGIHSPQVKDWIVKHMVQAEGWYVAHPDLTVRDIRRLKGVGTALDEFLDKISS